MASDRIAWNCLPPEIQNVIIGYLPVLGGKCSQLVTVSQVWRSIIEPLNFAEISLTVPRLADLNSQAILFRRRTQIRYIWFREPRGDLVLDISVYSPSDNQHWFKYLSFCSDTNLGECLSRHGHEQATLLTNDPAHGWIAGQQVLAPDRHAIERTFDEIICEGPFNDEEPEMQ
ncbi:hypothetical protein ACHAPQ_003694 [Fusarium lateritium]